MKKSLITLTTVVVAALAVSTSAMADSLFKQGDLTGGIGWNTNEKSDSYLYGKGRAFFTDNICGTLAMDIHHPSNALGTQYKYTNIGLEYHVPFTSSLDGYVSAGLGSSEFRVMTAGGASFTEVHGNGGIYYGAGVEYMFLPNWFFNIDATVNSYSTTNATFVPATTIGPTTTIAASINWDFMNVMPMIKK